VALASGKTLIEILTQSLVPIFVCLLFGYAAGRRNAVSNTNTRELVHSSLILSTALSILTLPLWIIFLNGAK
jgi:predicted permease